MNQTSNCTPCSARNPANESNRWTRYGVGMLLTTRSLGIAAALVNATEHLLMCEQRLGNRVGRRILTICDARNALQVEVDVARHRVVDDRERYRRPKKEEICVLKRPLGPLRFQGWERDRFEQHVAIVLPTFHVEGEALGPVVDLAGDHHRP